MDTSLECRRLLKKLTLTDRERLFVAEYVVDCDRRRAAHAVGKRRVDKLLRVPRVAMAVAARLKEREMATELTAEYIREYIHAVLEFCPTDYFYLAADGGWAIDPQSFAELPVCIKRLVESMELRYVSGRTYISVKFVSKSSALSLAAKFTLTQHVAATVAALPWDAIGGRIVGAEIDEVEEKLKELENKSIDNGHIRRDR